MFQASDIMKHPPIELHLGRIYKQERHVDTKVPGVFQMAGWGAVSQKEGQAKP